MRAKTLVVDANIARSAGEADECAKACRDTLVALQQRDHKLAMCEQLIAEWKKHAGRFAFRWLVAMQKRKKVEQFDLQFETAQLKVRFPRERQKQRGSEDIHLLVIANKVSKVVLANDEEARELFAAYAPEDVRNEISWSNPCREKDETLAWIEKGFPARKDLLLANYPYATR